MATKARKQDGESISDEDRRALAYRGDLAPNTFFDGREYRLATADELATVEPVAASIDVALDEQQRARDESGPSADVVATPS